MATDTVSLFQSSLTAAQMEKIWTGSVRFNAAQSMTEAEKAQARENIGATAHGSLLKILGHYDAVDELILSAPREAGAAYSVGTATPYNLYIYDALREEWRDYGQIRAADISARYVDNQPISAAAWTRDDTVFADYHFKAQIAFPIATADDLPIVAFTPKEALSGNFAPIAYAFDGYVEVWAREQPANDILIPVTTVIINGGNGVGLTNASGGISAGGIGTDKLADGAVTPAKIASGAVTRAKLAQDALYSPIININTSTYSIVSTDIGKTLKTNYNVNVAITLTQAVSRTMPVGTEIAIAKWSTAIYTTTLIGSGVRFGTTAYGLKSNQTLKMVDPYGMIAIKKISNSPSTGDGWLVTGNVEVVS